MTKNQENHFFIRSIYLLSGIRRDFQTAISFRAKLEKTALLSFRLIILREGRDTVPLIIMKEAGTCTSDSPLWNQAFHDVSTLITELVCNLHAKNYFW